MILYHNKIRIVTDANDNTYDVKIHKHRNKTYVMVDGVKFTITTPARSGDDWLVSRVSDGHGTVFEEDLAINEDTDNVRRCCAAVKAWIEYHATIQRIEQAGAFVEAINGSD